ncbi:hypothetical protein CTI14_58620, partial [Methylobacterium radiotolerans]
FGARIAPPPTPHDRRESRQCSKACCTPPTALIPWLDPQTIIGAAGPWALLVVCFIIFAEPVYWFGFLLPGDFGARIAPPPTPHDRRESRQCSKACCTPPTALIP